MYRFIAFIWNDKAEGPSLAARGLVRDLRAASPEWESLLSTHGMEILVAGRSGSCHAYVLHGDAGVIVGRLFVKRAVGDYSPNIAVDLGEVRKIQESCGRHLMDNYWGRYVAILRPRDGSTGLILRDPTGGMRCLLTQFEGVNVACSNIVDCMPFISRRNSVNWEHVVSYLWYDRMISGDTGLDGVRQVRAGECIAIGNDTIAARFYWSPVSIHNQRAIEDRETAEAELKLAVMRSVRSWASCYCSILHELSGGLDSSVVLSCLSALPGSTTVVCQNYYTDTRSGDERYFARLAAQHARVELIETPLLWSDRTLESMFGSAKVSTPAHLAMVPASHSMRESVARVRGVEAIFSGQGGDQLFQCIRSPSIAADYARRHGLRPELLKVILETARLTGQSIWSVAERVIANGLFRRLLDPYDQIVPPSFLSDATRDMLDPAQIRHPWVDEASNVPNAKRLAIFGIVDTQKFYDGECQYADVVHPLISQPVIELCLQIPSYLLSYGGVDRALVRDAFRQAVPSEIVNRATKSNTTSYFHTLLVKNLPFLREYLLDGLLMESRILDRRRTAAALSESTFVRDPYVIAAVLNAIRAEIWLRMWAPRNFRVAA